MLMDNPIRFDQFCYMIDKTLPDRFGLTDAECAAVREGSGSELFGPADRAVIDAVDETLETGTLSPESFERCREHVGSDEAAIELVTSIATWRLISHLTHGLDIRLEDGTASWPPDGKGPAAG